MRDISSKVGTNAGKIWSTLEKKGCLSKEEILEMACLKEDEFNIAIGWLARENKIAKEEERYKLDSTNLESYIGKHAGKVWKILDTWQDVDFESILRLSDLPEEEVHYAIGWLACEDKIVIDENNRFTLK